MPSTPNSLLLPFSHHPPSCGKLDSGLHFGPCFLTSMSSSSVSPTESPKYILSWPYFSPPPLTSLVQAITSHLIRPKSLSLLAAAPAPLHLNLAEHVQRAFSNINQTTSLPAKTHPRLHLITNSTSIYSPWGLALLFFLTSPHHSTLQTPSFPSVPWTQQTFSHRVSSSLQISA